MRSRGHCGKLTPLIPIGYITNSLFHFMSIKKSKNYTVTENLMNCAISGRYTIHFDDDTHPTSGIHPRYITALEPAGLI